MAIMTEEERNKCFAAIDIALSQMDTLVYENEALKAELTHAQSYKDDAERYRYCLQNSFPVLVKSGVTGIPDYWVCFRTILRAIMEVGRGESPNEAIANAMKESK